MADLCVKHIIPETVAPNLITVFGFLFVILPHIIFMYMDFDSWDHEVAGWAVALYGACTLIYQLLDNCDGKQARKTNNSTPLGLLFDHGCDAISTFMIIMNWAKFVRIGANTYGFIMILGPMIAFFFSAVETYYYGGLFLSIVNTPSDGNFAHGCLGILFISCGNSFVKNEVIFGLSIGTLLALGVFVISAITVIMNIRECLKKATSWQVFTKSLMFLYIVISFELIIMFPGKTDWLESNFTYMMWIFGLLGARLAKAAMINVTSGTHFNTLQVPVFVFGVWLNIFFFYVNSQKDVPKSHIDNYWLYTL